MYGSDRLRDIHALQYYLYGGVSPEEFEREGVRPRHISDTNIGTITGYAEMDLNTGEITCHSVRPRKKFQ
jgi:hypothetical protein